ncbi:hypothetical protein BDV95DRAFT_559216 [Massariosphaeria phaeospora]|uniref:Uncharacterized protein n=1 Tax=Massariosphaeria phaeospora TaxID=100035 RepID=A0A7C8MD30_9PLEO|nr:hypothetical protein BDV95DRAFT_559216 [Massariosphaeria phaeospora]
MGSRSIGELLLRPPSLFRTLPISRRPAICLRKGERTPWTAQRSITNSPPPRAAQPQLEDEPDAPIDSASQVSQSIDDLFTGMPNTSIRRSPLAPRRDASAERPAGRHIFGADFVNRRQPLNFDEMDLPDSTGLPASLRDTPDVPAIPEEEKIYPRLNPAYGRTVNLDPGKGRDLVRGLGMLGSLVTRNKIKYDLHIQRYHERPGLKRKRLNSVRWRAKFKIGFRDVVGRVSELTRKGW